MQTNTPPHTHTHLDRGQFSHDSTELFPKKPTCFCEQIVYIIELGCQLVLVGGKGANLPAEGGELGEDGSGT